MRVWRLTTQKFAATAFTGVGNRKAGSRWVPEGLLAVYTSEHISTAVLETLVHIDPGHLGNNHALIAADIPDDIAMDEVDLAALPPNWRERYEDDTLQQVGRDWIDRASSAILIVPSAIIPQERNIIINPQHPDFGVITTDTPENFKFDGRLMKP